MDGHQLDIQTLQKAIVNTNDNGKLLTYLKFLLLTFVPRELDNEVQRTYLERDYIRFIELLMQFVPNLYTILTEYIAYYENHYA